MNITAYKNSIALIQKKATKNNWTNYYTLHNLMVGALDSDIGINFPTSPTENIGILNGIIILMVKGKNNQFGTVKNGWDMNEIINELVLVYGEAYEPILQHMIRLYLQK